MWFALLTFLNMVMQKKHYTATRIVYPAQKPNNSVFLSKLTQWISVLFTAKSLGHWQSAAGEMMYGYFFSLGLVFAWGACWSKGRGGPVGASWCQLVDRGRNNVINTESIVQLSQDSKLQILLFVCLLVHICQQA